MQKVIFVCLLALSMCLCSPTQENGNPKATNAPNAVPKNAEPTISTHEAAKPTPTEHVPTQKPTEHPQQQNDTTTVAPTKPNESKINETKPSTEIPTPKEAVTTSKPSDKTTETVTTPKTIVTTEKAASTTPKAEVTTSKFTTAKPAADDAHAVQARKFDGPSFIGGIIMTLGLLAISFMGYKYYKNQTERNYHTL